jgi:hypothetical protein
VRPAGRVVRAGGTAKERPQPLRALADLAHEGRAHRMRSRGDRHTYLQTCIDGIHPVGDHAARAFGLFRLTTDCRDEHSFPIDRDLDLMRMLEPSYRFEVVAIQLQRELVLAIEWKDLMDDQAADASER